MDLLAAEMTAVTGAIPGAVRSPHEEFGAPAYARIDAPATSRPEGGAGQALGERRHGDRARGRANPGSDDDRAERGADRWPMAEM